MQTRLRAALAALRGRPVAYRLTFVGEPTWDVEPGSYVIDCRFVSGQ